MRIELHPAAQRELIASAAYYESKLPGLGTDFLGEFRQTLSLFDKNPEIGVVIELPYRRVVLNRFPFSIIYRFKEPTVRIVAVAHQRRKPGYWRAGNKNRFTPRPGLA